MAVKRRPKVAPPELPDPETAAERLLAQQAQAGPKVNWGSMATTEANARRRAADLPLERLGLKKPLRW